MTRFVILDHEPGNEPHHYKPPHWDWMFEHGDVLRTFTTARLDEIESMQQEILVPCEAIHDHRLEYLDYRGPIAGGRGVVSLVASGHFCEVPLLDSASTEISGMVLHDWRMTFNSFRDSAVEKIFCCRNRLRILEMRDRLFLQLIPSPN